MQNELPSNVSKLTRILPAIIRQSNRRSGRHWSNSGLLLHRHRNVAVRRQTDLVAFHVGHETAVDVMVVAFVLPLATVSLGQLDAVVFDPIDGAEMHTVRADDFHMLFDAAHIVHRRCPACYWTGPTHMAGFGSIAPTRPVWEP